MIFLSKLVTEVPHEYTKESIALMFAGCLEFAIKGLENGRQQAKTVIVKMLSISRNFQGTNLR